MSNGMSRVLKLAQAFGNGWFPASIYAGGIVAPSGYWKCKPYVPSVKACINGGWLEVGIGCMGETQYQPGYNAVRFVDDRDHLYLRLAPCVRVKENACAV